MDVKSTFKYHLILGAIIVFMGIFSNYIYVGGEQFINSFSLRRTVLKISFLTTFFSVYAINYKLICPRTLQRKKMVNFFMAMLLMLFVFAGLRYFLDEIVLYNITGLRNYYDGKRSFGYYVFDNSSYAMQALLFSTLMYLFFSYIRNSEASYKLEIEKRTEVFKSQINKLLTNVKDENSQEKASRRITVKSGKEATLIPVDSIHYIAASGSYIDIKTTDNTYVLRKSLDKILEEINDRKFVRIHRSTIINIDYIDKLVYPNPGEIDTKMKDGKVFRVSNSYKKEYLDLING